MPNNHSFFSSQNSVGLAILLRRASPIVVAMSRILDLFLGVNLIACSSSVFIMAYKMSWTRAPQMAAEIS